MNLSNCLKSYGHFCQRLACFTMPNHQIWTYHMSQVANFENFYFGLILHLILGKGMKFLVEKFSTSEVNSQKCQGGHGTLLVLLGLSVSGALQIGPQNIWCTLFGFPLKYHHKQNWSLFNTDVTSAFPPCGFLFIRWVKAVFIKHSNDNALTCHRTLIHYTVFLDWIDPKNHILVSWSDSLTGVKSQISYHFSWISLCRRL